METPGLMLKREREARGLTLSELSKVTRIPEIALQNIENNAFDALPAEVFVRGFLRNYARQLSIPASEIMQAYDAYRHQVAPVSEEPESPVLAFNADPLENRTDAPASENDDVPRQSFGFAYIAVILITVASIGLSIAFRGTGEAEESDVDFSMQNTNTAESPFLISNTSEGWIAE